MHDYGSRVPPKQILAWQPGCWCAAMIPLCEAHHGEKHGVLVEYPEQWAYLLWPPRTDSRPYADPVGWGIASVAPYAEIYAEVGSDPTHLLPDKDIDFLAALCWIRAAGGLPDWLLAIVQRAIDAAADLKAKQVRASVNATAPVGFARFMQRAIDGMH